MIDLSKNQRSINTSGAHVDGGDVEALGAHFERGHPDHGLTHCRVNPAEYDDPFASTAWRAYQAGYAAAKAEAVDVGEPYATHVVTTTASGRDQIETWKTNARFDSPDRSIDLYTADQLAAAVAKEREHCALVCEDVRRAVAEINGSGVAAAQQCADAIRAGAKEPSDG